MKELKKCHSIRITNSDYNFVTKLFGSLQRFIDAMLMTEPKMLERKAKIIKKMQAEVDRFDKENV